MGFDLEEQVEQEQFAVAEDDNKIDATIYKRLKEYKKAEKLQEKYNEKILAKHKPTTHMLDSKKYYMCDKCGTAHLKENGTIINNNNGQFFYCDDCTKQLYPKYRKVTFQNMTISGFYSDRW